MVAPVLERLRSTVGLKSRKTNRTWLCGKSHLARSGRQAGHFREISQEPVRRCHGWSRRKRLRPRPSQTVTLEKSIGRSMCVQFILP